MGAVGGNFLPRMQSKTHALRTLAPLRFRRLPGAIADVWQVHGDQDGGGHYIAPDPRLVVFLDDTPPPMALRTAPDTPEHIGLRGFFIPAGLPLTSRMAAPGQMRHLDIHLQAEGLQRRLAVGGVRGDIQLPRMIASSPALLALGRLAAAEVTEPRRGAMLLDGLVTALLGEVFALPQDDAAPGNGGLAPHQMTAVERHLRANLTRHVSVAELADIAGLSESWFAHAFKQTQGETPQRWQSRLRLLAARDLVERADLPLAHVAQATGFSDQAHLSRQFRAAFGQPPSAWRRARLQPP